MLSTYRILDLTDEKGFMCGKILAELGAEVIKIEKPSGDVSRNIGPFFGDLPHPERSLYWFAYNIGKKGITLNIETVDGRGIFDELLKTADVILESFQPGYLSKISLDYKHCQKTKPDIIMTSISPHGEGGPYNNFITYDLQAQAMGGTAYVCGYPGEPPVTWDGNLAYNQAGIQAAAGTMIALWQRVTTGKGQHVSVSIRESMVFLTTTEAPVVNWIETKTIKERKGYSQEDLGGRILRWIYPCKDGYVLFKLSLGRLGHITNSLVQWMHEEETASGLNKIVDHREIGLTDIDQEQIWQWEGIFADFFLSKTKKELLDGALKRSITLFPISNISDVSQNDQLAYRNYWQIFEYPEIHAGIKYPGVLFKASESPLQIKYKAPLIGEHNNTIYRELGYSEMQIRTLKESGII